MYFSKSKYLFASFLLVFLTIATVIGIYLAGTSQELRQQAAVVVDDSGSATEVCVECCAGGTTKRACSTAKTNPTQDALNKCGGVAGACVVHNDKPLACTPRAERCSGNDKVRCLDDGSGEIIIVKDGCKPQSTSAPTVTCPSGYVPNGQTCSSTQFLQTTTGTNNATCTKCTNKANCYDKNNGCKVAAINAASCENKTRYFNVQADCLAKSGVSTFIKAGEKCTSTSGCQCTTGPETGKNIANGASCGVKYCYTSADGCAALLPAADKVKCNGTSEFEVKADCQKNLGDTLNCTSTLNRPNTCGCTANNQCLSQYCQITTTNVSNAVGVCKDKSESYNCNSTTNRPEGCGCATSPQCASGVCGSDKKCTTVTSACITQLGSKVAYDNAKNGCNNSGGGWDEASCSCKVLTCTEKLGGQDVYLTQKGYCTSYGTWDEKTCKCIVNPSLAPSPKLSPEVKDIYPVCNQSYIADQAGYRTGLIQCKNSGGEIKWQCPQFFSWNQTSLKCTIKLRDGTIADTSSVSCRELTVDGSSYLDCVPKETVTSPKNMPYNDETVLTCNQMQENYKFDTYDACGVNKKGNKVCSSCLNGAGLKQYYCPSGYQDNSRNGICICDQYETTSDVAAIAALNKDYEKTKVKGEGLASSVLSLPGKVTDVTIDATFKAPSYVEKAGNVVVGAGEDLEPYLVPLLRPAVEGYVDLMGVMYGEEGAEAALNNPFTGNYLSCVASGDSSCILEESAKLGAGSTFAAAGIVATPEIAMYTYVYGNTYVAAPVASVAIGGAQALSNTSLGQTVSNVINYSIGGVSINTAGTTALAGASSYITAKSSWETGTTLTDISTITSGPNDILESIGNVGTGPDLFSNSDEVIGSGLGLVKMRDNLETVLSISNQADPNNNYLPTSIDPLSITSAFLSN